MMTGQARPLSGLVPREDRQVVDEWVHRILDVLGPDASSDDPEQACRTAAEAAEELSAYLWLLIHRYRS